MLRTWWGPGIFALVWEYLFNVRVTLRLKWLTSTECQARSLSCVPLSDRRSCSPDPKSSFSWGKRHAVLQDKSHTLLRPRVKRMSPVILTFVWDSKQEEQEYLFALSHTFECIISPSQTNSDDMLVKGLLPSPPLIERGLPGRDAQAWLTIVHLCQWTQQ